MAVQQKSFVRFVYVIRKYCPEDLKSSDLKFLFYKI